ncbi:hypothetical protein RRF57_012564 [Xylaria bambusicola]|uniref:Uncharacterized protein n=1 Tax=Xylaria bambusicola TaxID=326684 RepID=A0AAN7UVE0_9PEZI
MVTTAVERAICGSARKGALAKRVGRQNAGRVEDGYEPLITVHVVVAVGREVGTVEIWSMLDDGDRGAHEPYPPVDASTSAPRSRLLGRTLLAVGGSL